MGSEGPGEKRVDFSFSKNRRHDNLLLSSNAASPVSTTGGGESSRKKNLLAPGRRNSLKRLNPVERIQGNPSLFSLISFVRRWPDFARVGEIDRWLRKHTGLYRSAADRDGGRIALSAQ
jgi:hypothetical protein